MVLNFNRIEKKRLKQVLDKYAQSLVDYQKDPANAASAGWDVIRALKSDILEVSKEVSISHPEFEEASFALEAAKTQDKYCYVVLRNAKKGIYQVNYSRWIKDDE